LKKALILRLKSGFHFGQYGSKEIPPFQAGDLSPKFFDAISDIISRFRQPQLLVEPSIRADPITLVS
jgi:hypothetical protein